MKWERLLIVGFFLGALSGAAAAAAGTVGSKDEPSIHPYFSRQLLETSARAGNEASKWELAWINTNQGSLSRAWSWVEELPVKDDGQAYFKAWLAWRTSHTGEALKTLSTSGCRSYECDALGVNVYWDKKSFHEAASLALKAFENAKTPQSYHLALLAALTAKDVQSFDRLEASKPWREERGFTAWRPAILALLKMRLNM